MVHKKNGSKLFKCIAAATAAFSLVFTTGCDKRESTAYKTAYIMSTVVTQQLTGTESESAAAKVEELLYGFEDETSLYTDGSYVREINEAAGTDAVEIDESEYALLLNAKECCEKSGGIFDVSVGPLTLLWNINGENPHVPESEAVAFAASLVDYSKLELFTGESKYYARLNTMGGALDLGGVAKGYSLDLCKESLIESGINYGFVSIGGNVLVYGDKDGRGFNVGLRVPEKDSDGSFCVLNLRNTVVSTTGGYERFFVEDGVTYHHVLDPRTGYPAKTDLISVSVVNESGLTADFLSTWLYIIGLDEATKTANENGYEVVLVDENNNVYVSRSLEDNMVSALSDTNNYTFYYI